MSPGSGPATKAAAAPCILVVDDDRRMVELLEIAFAAHGFRVLTAADGDQAMKRTLTERPDLVVLDVRLPRKSGLEVCEWLRRNPDDAHVPVIMVSAVTDGETRLQAFTRGADDYLTKPFSPKELIARIKRLLVRSSESRESRERVARLEREVAAAREEARRARLGTEREQRLCETAFGPGLELQGVLDLDELARRLLLDVRLRLGVRFAGLLLPETADGALVPAAASGDSLDRLAGLALEPRGPLGALVSGLERPVARRDLERFPDLRAEVAPFVAAGVMLLAPLRSPEGLEGLLVLDERHDGLEPGPLELETLTGLCRFAAVAVGNAGRARASVERVLEEMTARATLTASLRVARIEARFLADHAARATLLPPRLRRLVGHGIGLGLGTWNEAEASALERLEADDATGMARDLRRLTDRVCGAAPADGGAPADGAAPEEVRAEGLLAVALAFAEERSREAAVDVALAGALQRAGSGLDPCTRQALEAAARELTLSEIDAA